MAKIAAQSNRTLTREFMRRINKRATELLPLAFKDFQRRMVEDFIAQEVLGNPEDWQPLEKVSD